MGLYNGSLTREQFMFREMRIVARLYKNGLSNAEITDTVYRDNLFQYPTERMVANRATVCLRRLDAMVPTDAVCAARGIDVWFSVVDIIGEKKIEECRKIAAKCGVSLRVRPYLADSE